MQIGGSAALRGDVVEKAQSVAFSGVDIKKVPKSTVRPTKFGWR
jgi:hypothetical protein